MNSNPCKRARFNREKVTMDSENLPDLDAQMTEFVNCALDNFTENHHHLYVLMDLSNDDESAMTRLQGLLLQQQFFVEQSVSMYLDVIKPSIPNSQLVVLAKRFAMSVYETKLQSMMQNATMMNDHRSLTNNNVVPYSPSTASTFSCSEKSWNADSSSMYFEGIEAPVEPQKHVVMPITMPECSPLSLKSYAYHHADHDRATASLQFDDYEEEDMEVANMMDVGGGYHHETSSLSSSSSSSSSSVQKACSSPPSSHPPSPFSLLAGSVNCAAVVPA